MTPYILGMINARGGSKGVPRKNIRDLGGKPLIAWSIDVAKQVPELSRCIVSTEDDEIAEIAVKYGGDVPFMRPPHLASDEAIQLDTILYNVKKIESSLGHEIDAIALLQPTHPFRTAEDVSGCIKLLQDTNADCAITIAPNKHHPLGLWKRQENADGLKMFLNADSDLSQGFNRQEMPELFMRTGAVYVISRNCLINNQSLYGSYVEGYVVNGFRSWFNIDDEDDLEFAQAWVNYKLGTPQK